MNTNLDEKSSKARIVTKKGEHRFAKGELSKLVLTQLRLSREPLTISEITQKIKNVMNYDFEFKTNVKDAIKTLKDRKLVEVASTIGRINTYTIKDLSD